MNLILWPLAVIAGLLALGLIALGCILLVMWASYSWNNRHA